MSNTIVINDYMFFTISVTLIFDLFQRYFSTIKVPGHVSYPDTAISSFVIRPNKGCGHTDTQTNRQTPALQ